MSYQCVSPPVDTAERLNLADNGLSVADISDTWMYMTNIRRF